jgi:myo-inositol-1(or 4)-monophosphatase
VAGRELEIYLHSVRGRSGSMRWTTGMYFAVGCVSAATALLQPLAPQTFRRLRGAGAGTGGALRMCGPGVAPYSTDELASVLSVAKEAARAAGAVMQANIGAAVTKTKCSNKDLLTEIDPLCQRVISDKVAANFPAHKFLGEESVAAGDEASSEALADLIKADWLWVVDPIDGTTNFVQGQPMSVISVGVAHKGNLVVGVIMDPYRDELFWASAGGGAFCNDLKISTGAELTLGEAVIAAGSPPNMRSIKPSLRGVNALMPECRTIRMLGSAALHLAWIACGRLSAYFEPDLNSWDTAAGAVILREAGGRISDLHGSEYELSTRPILASNGHTHDAILHVLQVGGCVHGGGSVGAARAVSVPAPEFCLDRVLDGSATSLTSRSPDSTLRVTARYSHIDRS